MVEQSGISFFAQPLAVFWLIVYGANYSAMLNAASRVRAFNTALIWRCKKQPGAAKAAWCRLLIALGLLNVAPFGFGYVMARIAGSWNWPTGWTVLFFGVASFVPFACWRVFGALCSSPDLMFRDDPARGEKDGGQEQAEKLKVPAKTAFEQVLSEMGEYTPREHLKGALFYIVFLVPLAVHAICAWRNWRL